MSVDYMQVKTRVTVISIDHLPRFTPLFMALPEGVSGAQQCRCDSIS